MSDIKEEPSKKRLPPGVQKLTIKDAFSSYIKNFQSQVGMATGDLNALYNSQMNEIVQNMLQAEISIVTLTKKNTVLEKDRNQLLAKLQKFESAKVVKPVAIIKTKPKPKRK